MSIATCQLPVTLAQEDEGQAGAGVFEITVTTEPDEDGTASGGGAYDEGSEAILTATAHEGYSFSGWLEVGELIGANTELSFVVEGDRALVARFEQAKLEPAVEAEEEPGATGSPPAETLEEEHNPIEDKHTPPGGEMFNSPAGSGQPGDGWEWRNSLPQGHDLNAVTWGGDKFVAAVTGGAIGMSPDGVNWTTFISVASTYQ